MAEGDCDEFSGADMAKRFAGDLWVASAFRAAGSFVTVIKYPEDKKANVFVNFSSIHEVDSRQSTSLFYTPKFDWTRSIHSRNNRLDCYCALESVTVPSS